MRAAKRLLVHVGVDPVFYNRGDALPDEIAETLAASLLLNDDGTEVVSSSSGGSEEGSGTGSGDGSGNGSNDELPAGGSADDILNWVMSVGGAERGGRVAVALEAEAAGKQRKGLTASLTALLK